LDVELQQAIDQWLEKKGNSLNKLAKKAGVGYSTIRRALQNEQDSSPRTLLLIGAVVLSPERCMAIFKGQFPEFFMVGAKETTNGELVRDRLMSDNFSHGIISLAMRGTSRDEVKEEYGRYGLETLDDLLKEGVISEKDGAIYAENIDINSIDDVCKAVKLSADQLCPNNLISACWWSEGWSPQGIVTLARACTELTAKVADMRHNPKLRGELSATIGMYMFRRGNKWL
jgi:transcriptional regulator with XRE-family HTH domain